MKKGKLVLAFFLIALLMLAVMPFGFAKKGGKSAEHRRYPVHPLMKVKGDGSSRPLHPSDMPDGRPRHPLGKVVPPIPEPDPTPDPDPIVDPEPTPDPKPTPEPTPESKPTTLSTFELLGIIYSLALFFVILWGLIKGNKEDY